MLSDLQAVSNSKTICVFVCLTNYKMHEIIGEY